ncbi:MAG: tRNA lysidine(34) synthetase TilS [Spirochaetales bacterium]|nr:tRNA lysidine(34) synthetase TilS [Spirochaetales bacterium]
MGSTSNRLKEGVRRWYGSRQLSLDSRQLVAFSGGADSTALLFILSELYRMAGLPLSQLKAAYLNHNIRSSAELENEIAMLKKNTEKFGVELIIASVSEGELDERARNEKRSLEDVAREARYDFFERLIREEDFDYLVLAHHGNDQAETMVTRYFQGSGFSGLGGIRPVQGKRIRPLLSYPKAELVACLEEENITWSEDSTNGDNQILRNDLRSSLMPRIEKTFPGYERSLNQLSEKIFRYEECLAEMGDRLPWVFEADHCHMDRELFLGAHPAIREFSLYSAIDRLLQGIRLSGGKGRRVPYRFIRPLLEKEAPRTLNLQGHALSISLNQDKIVLKRRD